MEVAAPGTPLYIRTDKGFADARTGSLVAAPPPVNLRLVIVNDSVRFAIETAEGALDLPRRAPQRGSRRPMRFSNRPMPVRCR